MKAYNFKEGWNKYCGKTEDEYIKETTLADSKDDVKEMIRNYIINNDLTEDVERVLVDLYCNENLLRKTHIVYDGSYRNVVALVRPDGIRIQYNKGEDEWFKFAEDFAEIFFLNMDNVSWKEINDSNICRLY